LHIEVFFFSKKKSPIFNSFGWKVDFLFITKSSIEYLKFSS